MLQTLLNKVKKPRPTGVTCDYCGWNGTVEEVATARVMNTDSSVYTIKTCPRCGRNGGLIVHPEK